MSVPIAIVGAGPVGLATALGLARRGIPSTVFERNPTTSRRSKAAGVHVRTAEIFRQWGIGDRFAEPARRLGAISIRDARDDRVLLHADLSRLEDEAEEPGLLMIEQSATERHLLEALAETGLADVRFGTEVERMRQDDRGVDLEVRGADGAATERAAYVVGADGASSTVRGLLGLSFDGVTLPVRPTLADVAVADGRDDLPWPRMRNDAGGITSALRLRAGLWRIIRLEPGEPPDPAASHDGLEDEIADRARSVLGTGPLDVRWVSRFRFHRRSSPRMRVGRVVLAGDAAHVHPPAGGQGMNVGIQDAHNLAWKLDACLAGADPDVVLDGYEAERMAIVGNVSSFTTGVTRVFLQSPSLVRSAAFGLFGTFLKSGAAQSRFARRLSMLNLDYPKEALLGPAPGSCAGRRLPNVRLVAPDGGRLRLYDLLPYGPALLDLREDAASRLGDGEGTVVRTVVRIGPGGYREEGDLLRRFVGNGADRVMVRPDLHVAGAYSKDADLDAASEAALGGLAS